METSTSLLDRLRDRPDEESWRRLDRLYRPLIQRWLSQDPSLRDDADDLTQEILSVVCQELAGFQRQRTGSFRNWLRQITVYRVKGHYRKRQLLPRPQGGDAEGSLLAELADDRSDLVKRWDREHNEHVVAQLLEMIAEEFNDTHVRAFRRHVFDEVRAADVAGELGVSVNVVLLARSRILARLREIGKGLLE